MDDVALEHLASVLRGRQRDLVGPGESGREVAQVGASVLADGFAVPIPGPDDPVAPRGGEATIETFVVDQPDGRATAMGADAAVGAWWQDAVEELVGRVVNALEPFGVELAGPIYVTTSATPVDQVIGQPHLDDDQLDPEAGVGLVAIAASHDGPRVARGTLACPRANASGPLGLDQSALDHWFDPTSATADRVQHTAADQIVLFPRFGQLHAGPALAAEPGGGSGAGIRNLLVLRADTVPSDAGSDRQAVAGRAGSGPT